MPAMAFSAYLLQLSMFVAGSSSPEGWSPEVAVNIVGKHCHAVEARIFKHFCCLPDEGRVSEYFAGARLSMSPMT